MKRELVQINGIRLGPRLGFGIGLGGVEDAGEEEREADLRDRVHGAGVLLAHARELRGACCDLVHEGEDGGDQEGDGGVVGLRGSIKLDPAGVKCD